MRAMGSLQEFGHQPNLWPPNRIGEIPLRNLLTVRNAAYERREVPNQGNGSRLRLNAMDMRAPFASCGKTI
jgi:hypothetical protein